MFVPILATKLYIPLPRSKVIFRPRLVELLNEGLSLRRKLTLISAPAGFGKTTLVSEWVAGCGQQREPKVRIAWLSLDEGDNDPIRFLTYLVSALQIIKPNFGKGVLAVLQSPQPPPIESILSILLNEIATAPDHFVLVLDDYHVIDSQPVDAAGTASSVSGLRSSLTPLNAAKSVDGALAFLLEHLPPQMHLVITTREDPRLPLARLRARSQLTELRAADLRFTPAEAAEFLNQAMGLNLSAENIAALETRTEGWIAGLQMAALALQGTLSKQGLPDAASFIQSFTGSHRFVLDYLLEEVLQRQPVAVQAFLLRTSILERLCGPLCDAVLCSPVGCGEETLIAIERANLFILPLDSERKWYRYHHLFADLLRQRLGKSLSTGEMSELHICASDWYEHNSLLFEAFHHATLANDVERAERLMESREMGLRLYSVAMPIQDWLASLPKTVLDSRPRLWVRSATLALMGGQTTGVEEKLQAAEHALQASEPDEYIRDLIGQIACARATLALTRYDPEAMLTQARRALAFLSPENLTFRFTANWALASASILQGDRATAAQACLEGISISQTTGDVFSIILATTNLGRVQELENQLYQAAETYQRVLDLSGDHPHPNAGEVHQGLARIYYQWNDLDTAGQHGLQGLQLTRQFDRVIDRFILSEVFLAQSKLSQGEVRDAEARLAHTEQTARQKNYLLRLPDIAAAQVTVLLRQGRLTAADQLARQFDLPLSQARVFIAQGNAPAALDILGPYRQQMEARGWADERLRAMVLQAVALHLKGEKAPAVQHLSEALVLAEPGGFTRLFVDEGAPMAELLSTAVERGIRPGYVNKLLAAFEGETADDRSSDDDRSSSDEQPPSSVPGPSSLVEPEAQPVDPLSPRELEVLRLIAQGLSNQEIGERLFLALDTVKGHNRRIFDKLQVQRRTEAIARARELGLL